MGKWHGFMAMRSKEAQTLDAPVLKLCLTTRLHVVSANVVNLWAIFSRTMKSNTLCTPNDGGFLD